MQINEQTQELLNDEIVGLDKNLFELATIKEELQGQVLQSSKNNLFLTERRRSHLMQTSSIEILT